LINRYCSTFFYQDWKFFIPPPSHNYLLLVNVPDEGPVDVFAEVRAQHQKNRFSGKGHLLISLVNSIHHFEKNCVQASGDVSADANFKLLQFECSRYIALSRKQNYKLLPLYLLAQPLGKIPPTVYFSVHTFL
jgi:hypothetical protein